MAQRQLEPGQGRGRGRGRGKGRGKGIGKNKNSTSNSQEANARQEHIQETFADILSREDPNPIIPVETKEVECPKPKRKSRAKTDKGEGKEEKTEKEAKTDKSEEKVDAKTARKQGPGRKKPAAAIVPQQTADKHDDNITTAECEAKKRKTEDHSGCWDKHQSHQQAKVARKQKAQTGIEAIQNCGIPILSSKVGNGFDKLNLFCKYLLRLSFEMLFQNAAPHVDLILGALLSGQRFNVMMFLQWTLSSTAWASTSHTWRLSWPISRLNIYICNRSSNQNIYINCPLSGGCERWLHNDVEQVWFTAASAS